MNSVSTVTNGCWAKREQTALSAFVVVMSSMGRL
jgi:hypothetical protein